MIRFYGQSNFIILEGQREVECAFHCIHIFSVQGPSLGSSDPKSSRYVICFAILKPAGQFLKIPLRHQYCIFVFWLRKVV